MCTGSGRQCVRSVVLFSYVDGLKFLPQLWSNLGEKKNKKYVYTRSKAWFHCNKWLFWVNWHSRFFLCQTIHQHHSQIFLSSTLLSERFEDAKCEMLQSITFHLYWTVSSTVPGSKQHCDFKAWTFKRVLELPSRVLFTSTVLCNTSFVCYISMPFLHTKNVDSSVHK